MTADGGTSPGTGTGTGPGIGTGVGYAACHHGEILQGVFLDRRGRARAGLVTLPIQGPGTRAEFTLRPGTSPGRLTVFPADRAKALRAAALTLAECGARRGREPGRGGELTLSGDVPLGLGMGSSSSDVIATIRAVADAHRLRLPPATIARLAVRAERASDPLMLGGRPLLFAQREGRVLEVLGSALPPAVVVGCVLGGGSPVDTLSLPAPRHGHEDVVAYERLRDLLRRAVADADTALLGRVSTESARRAQHLREQPEFGLLDRIAGRVGAVGVQIAHSGNVAGLLFDPAAPDLRHRLRRCARALKTCGIPVTRTFATGTTSEEQPHGRAHSRLDRPTRSDPPRRRAHLSALRDDEGGLRHGGGTAAARHRHRTTR
ncbi:GHMP kinase [Streptomyces sp. NPDC006645]|uniref:GHMP family kinase ATP-binding protein n=1 Tax=unclassified Streptomyces TaxID=2593676 RepID=UPI00339DFD6C